MLAEGGFLEWIHFSCMWQPATPCRQPHASLRDEQVDSLRRLAHGTTTKRRVLPSGRTVSIPALVIHFPPHDPDRLPPGTPYYQRAGTQLPGSYLTKPLVVVDSQPLFGELAIARCLERDGWEAVWLDSYHSKKERLFWRDLPDRSLPFDLSRVQVAHEAYERIFIVNGGVGGFFDVLAWKGSEVVFIEYKGARDGPNGNEL